MLPIINNNIIIRTRVPFPRNPVLLSNSISTGYPKISFPSLHLRTSVLFTIRPLAGVLISLLIALHASVSFHIKPAAFCVNSQKTYDFSMVHELKGGGDGSEKDIPTSGDTGRSDYEALRLERIAANRQILVDLGLASALDGLQALKVRTSPIIC